jgi:hypothetical protein
LKATVVVFSSPSFADLRVVFGWIWCNPPLTILPSFIGGWFGSGGCRLSDASTAIASLFIAGNLKSLHVAVRTW